jgi:hypothetical protein
MKTNAMPRSQRPTHRARNEAEMSAELHALREDALREEMRQLRQALAGATPRH